ncbi:MAG: Gfo/Idh/MocA family oxidoreductase [Clostridiales Family XIII bacterium]|jgi:predicted dehydrogenase|nr:Gfo/Idh/MocA family oxidoreductase [Clostridiales Family XIII bacterium]
MINIGILGSGAVLKWHLLGIDGTEGARLAALSSRNEVTGRAACEKYGAAYYKDYNDFLDKEKTLDGVIVLFPNHMHYEICNLVLDAGCRHILCEKPLGIDLEQSRRLVEKVQKTGAVFQAAYMKRFNPGFRKIKEALDVIGNIEFVNCTTVESGAANQVSQRDSSSPWKTDPALSGGGNLTHVGSHVVDLLRFLFGEVKTVSCTLRRDSEDAPEYYANARLKMSNGVNADLRIGRVDIPDLGPGWEIFNGGWNEYVEVIGDRGYIRADNPSWEGLGAIRVTSWFKGMHGPKTEYFESRLQWANEISAFAKACGAGRLCSDSSSAVDAYRVDYIVKKMRLSDEMNGETVSAD